MDENFSYQELQIMLDAIDIWIEEKERLYEVLLPNDPLCDELSHFLYVAQMLRKKLRKISRSIEKKG